MALISFESKAEAIWGGAGWAYRQVIRDLSPYAQGDPEFREALKQADPLASLMVDRLDAALQQRITRAIATMTRDILDGTRLSSIAQHHADRETQELYLDGLRALGSIAERYLRANGP